MRGHELPGAPHATSRSWPPAGAGLVLIYRPASAKIKPSGSRGSFPSAQAAGDSAGGGGERVPSQAEGQRAVLAAGSSGGSRPAWARAGCARVSPPCRGCRMKERGRRPDAHSQPRSPPRFSGTSPRIGPDPGKLAFGLPGAVPGEGSPRAAGGARPPPRPVRPPSRLASAPRSPFPSSLTKSVADRRAFPREPEPGP